MSKCHHRETAGGFCLDCGADTARAEIEGDTGPRADVKAGQVLPLEQRKEHALMLKALKSVKAECDHMQPHLDACWVCLVKHTLAQVQQ
jgi:hypothetical protein